MVLCYESRRLARSLGPGSAVGEGGRKRGEIRKMLARGKKNSLADFFFFPYTDFFLLFLPMRSPVLGYLARSREQIRLCFFTS